MLCWVSQGGYKVEDSKLSQEYKFTNILSSIQSKECYHLLLEVALPNLDSKSDSEPMIPRLCEYYSEPIYKNEMLMIICNLNCCDCADEIGGRNDKLNAQCDCILVSKEADIADKMAEKGDSRNARNALSEAKENIQQSTHVFLLEGDRKARIF